MYAEKRMYFFTEIFQIGIYTFEKNQHLQSWLEMRLEFVAEKIIYHKLYKLIMIILS